MNKEEPSVTNTDIDREYVLAALCGVLINGGNPQLLCNRYGINDTERQRVEVVAIQHLLARGYADQAKALAATTNFTGEELQILAHEVLRGTVFDQTWLNPTPALRALGGILDGYTVIIDSKTQRFNYDGAYRCWQPQRRIKCGEMNLIVAFIQGDGLETYIQDRKIPEELRRLMAVILQCRTAT